MSSATSSPRTGSRAPAPSRPLTVAVTGATGTIGPALLRRLTEDDAVGRVRVLGRTEPEQDGVEFLRADVRDTGAVAEAVRGADVVVHAAFAIYGARHAEPALFDTNV